MRPLGELIQDAEAMKRFGNTVVVWDYHARKPLQTLQVPGAPLEIYSRKIGSPVNMVSQSWDGKRVYFTGSLLANWDNGRAENEQFLKAFSWDGKQLGPLFEVDFARQALGRPHSMNFGQLGFYAAGRQIGERIAEGR
jgi:selenium-binding protein 1